MTEPLRAYDPPRVGSYRIQARLGEGGMGEVFLGLSPGGRKVAVKVIRSEFAADPKFRARFAGEMEAARTVGGFHTAQVVDADTSAAAPWLVTAYIPGPSLLEVVRRDGPLDAGRVRALGAGLAEGLAAIHHCGLVHRDLKPGNVIMADDGPRIIDFGIARAAGAAAHTTVGVAIGTYAYMSPEQVRAAPDDPAGPAGDVFALGCVLAYAATGNTPFRADTIPALIHRILSEPPDLSGLPAGLAPLIGRCLAKDPADRPGVTEILAELSGERIPASTARTTTATKRLVRTLVEPGAVRVRRPAGPRSLRPRKDPGGAAIAMFGILLMWAAVGVYALRPLVALGDGALSRTGLQFAMDDPWIFAVLGGAALASAMPWIELDKHDRTHPLLMLIPVLAMNIGIAFACFLPVDRLANGDLHSDSPYPRTALCLCIALSTLGGALALHAPNRWMRDVLDPFGAIGKIAVAGVGVVETAVVLLAWLIPAPWTPRGAHVILLEDGGESGRRILAGVLFVVLCVPLLSLARRPGKDA